MKSFDFDFTKIAIIIVAVIGLMFFAGLIIFPVRNYNKVEHHTLTVYSVNTQQSVSGTKEFMTTRYRYLIGTDKGMYEISPDGLCASPMFGRIESGKTYKCMTRGYRYNTFGLYPYIVEATEVKGEEE